MLAPPTRRKLRTSRPPGVFWCEVILGKTYLSDLLGYFFVGFSSENGTENATPPQGTREWPYTHTLRQRPVREAQVFEWIDKPFETCKSSGSFLASHPHSKGDTTQDSHDISMVDPQEIPLSRHSLRVLHQPGKTRIKYCKS